MDADPAAKLKPGDRVRMSWEEYVSLDLGDLRGEYVDGYLVVRGLPTGRHQDVVFALMRRIHEVLPDGFRVRTHWGWKASADQFGPDVIVFEDVDEDRRYYGVPHLAVEVLSSNRRYDLVLKRRKYAAAGLPRYWAIDPAGPEILVMEQRAGELVDVARHGPGTQVTLDIGPAAVTLDPADLTR